MTSQTKQCTRPSRLSIPTGRRREAGSYPRAILRQLCILPVLEALITMQLAGESGRPTFVISGSLAFDYIMTYPGSFQDHIIPDKTHVLSVSFLFDSLRRYRGGE